MRIVFRRQVMRGSDSSDGPATQVLVARVAILPQLRRVAALLTPVRHQKVSNGSFREVVWTTLQCAPRFIGPSNDLETQTSRDWELA